MKHFVALASIFTLSLFCKAQALEAEDAGAPLAVANTTRKGEIVAGTLPLPPSSAWKIVPGSVSGKSVRQPELTLPAAEHKKLSEQIDPNSRVSKTIDKQRQRNGLSAAYQYQNEMNDSAFKNKGIVAREVVEKVSAAPSPYNQADQNDGPFWYVPEDATYLFRAKGSWATNNAVNLIELRPLLDDGHHWVGTANRLVRYVPVDQELIKKYNLTIRPLTQKKTQPAKLENLNYQIVGMHNPKAQDELRFAVTNSVVGGRSIACAWNPGAEPPEAGDDIDETWSKARVTSWIRTSGVKPLSPSPLMHSWLYATPGSRESITSFMSSREPQGWRVRRRRDNTTSVFGLLGGHAALSETLQLQELGKLEKDSQRDIPIADVKGVTVESHPYEEMLGDNPGGRLPLAEVVPEDRFLVYMAKPKSLLAFLESGSDFISRLGVMATGRAFTYNLEERYLARFGMNRALVENILKADLVSEAALFLPDLFLIDGTDITLVCRLKQADTMLKLMAFSGLDLKNAKAPVPIKNSSGYTSYAAMRDDILIVGTRESEVSMALALATDATAASLGRATEFRYMLTQLPPTENTRIYTYFSDSFIRRLVGPEVKIGQLRRLAAKARLLDVMGSSLLYKYDKQRPAKDIAEMRRDGYLSDKDYSDVTLGDDGLPRSAEYGQLSDFASLLAHPITQVSSFEKQSYDSYRDEYTRFWRQFFDPIAIRLDDVDGENGPELELTTFILPLLDHSLYNGIKESLVTNADMRPGFLPEISPPPPVMVSITLAERLWQESIDDAAQLADDSAIGESFLEFANSIGPSLHLAIHDSNPIIAFGSGETLALGASLEGDADTMLAIQALVSILTRPCTLAVELQDVQAARKFLLDKGLNFLAAKSHSKTQVYKIADQDAWIVAVDLFGIVLRFKIEVADNLLFVHNIPWTPNLRVGSVLRPDSPAIELTLRPGRATTQRGAMFIAAQERLRATAFSGMSDLLPLLLNGATMEGALEQHQRWLGFTPRHPAGGAWTYSNGVLGSTLYGTPQDPVQPSSDAMKTEGGILDGVEMVDVSMKFENTGMRTRIKWRNTVATEK